MRFVLCTVVIALLSLGGCAAPSPSDAGSKDRPTRGEGDADRPLAFVSGRSVRMADLRDSLLEAAGGDALANLILDRGLARRLASLGIEVTESDLAAEREAMLRSLDAEDEDRAMRLLRRLRERRNLGPRRYAAMLERNAALRKLVRQNGDVVISDAELRVAYEAAYGPKVRVRLALLPTLPAARELRAAVRRSERPVARFIELAVERSVDGSASRGGLLRPISPADTAYPPAFREALKGFDEDAERGAVSSVVVLDDGFALLQFIERVEASDVEWEEIRGTLRNTLQQRELRREMDRTARSVLADADVTILNDALAESWRGDASRR